MNGRIFGILGVMLLTGSLTYAQTSSGTLTQQQVQAKVDEMAKVFADKAAVDVTKIKADTEAKKQTAKQSQSKIVTGKIEAIELYEKHFVGRIGHLSFGGWGVELFEDTLLDGRTTFADVKVKDYVRVEYYPYGGFDHAVSVTYVTQK